MLAVGIVALMVINYFKPSTIVAPKPTGTPALESTSDVAKMGPASIYPDPNRTPGVANPDITQANINDTICNPNWSTKMIRPPESYTGRLKARQIDEWELQGTMSDYEEDHFISLELGGNPTDPRNLWPEPYRPKPGAREKDVVERQLHKQVCEGTLTLDQAQRAITADWYKVYLTVGQ
jgi:hypothetical protein